MRIRIERNDELTTAIADANRLKAEKAAAEERYKEAEARLIKLMEAEGVRSSTKEIEGVSIRATLVERERVTIDEPSLRKALGARLFNKLTVRKLDQGLLKQAIVDEQVDPVVVSQHSVITRDRAYVRLSMAEEQ